MTRIVRLCLSIVLVGATCAVLSAQTSEGVDILLSKARSLEARGRMDLAALNWNQVLLVDPNQSEALEGLARYAKQTGNADAYRAYLDRLRTINPRNPAIAAIEQAHLMTSQELKLLDDAGRLATEHKPDEAMTIYRRVFGDAPPPGRWAEAFYETEAASTGGREQAVAQLRDRVSRDPANDVYRMWLARVLTYDPTTRMDGLRLLESIHDAGAIELARAAWRQALLWEEGNPAALASLEAYVERYPDLELQNDLLEQQGFKALREKDLTTAQARFEDLARRSPDDVDAIVGLGYVRLGQKKFDQSLALFSRARARSPERPDVKDGYESARFWLAIERGDATQAAKPDAAIAAYEEALAFRPGNEQALLGIAQIMQRRGDLAGAQARYEQVLDDSPNNADALAGLGYVRLGQKNFEAAGQLFARARALQPDRRDVDEAYRTAMFWTAMQRGVTALAGHRPDAAIASYQAALAIDADAKDALVGLADAIRLSGNLAGALQVYHRLATADPSDVRGWLGLVGTTLASHDAQAALEIVHTIPESTRPRLETNPEYLALLAQVLYRTNQPAAGDQALYSALDLAMRSDSEAAVNARLDLAGLLMEQGNDSQAALVYRRVTERYSDNATAWEGLIGAYVRMQDFPNAAEALRSMPRSANDAAMNSAGFLKVLATVYTSEGRCVDAETLLTRSINLDRAAGLPFPDTQLQLAALWAREGRHNRASEGYSEVLAGNRQSLEAWRGYVTALHNDQQDYAALNAVERMPETVRTDLLDDSDFLRLVGGVQAAAGKNDQAVDALQKARARRRALGQAPLVDLDVQLAWTMMASPKHTEEVPALVEEVRARGFLTSQQRQAVDDITSAWNLRTANAAMVTQDPARAIAVLTSAQRALPNDARIPEALASVYAQEGEFGRAVDVYRSWGMVGATASDYRTAATNALAADRSIVAEQFLMEGRQRWPHDVELLRMTATRALAQGAYDRAEYYLTAALAAARGEDKEVVSPVQNAQAAGPAGAVVCRQDGAANAATYGVSARDAAPPLRETGKPSDQPQASPQRIVDELDAVKNRNAPFVGVASPMTLRMGDPGVNRLIIRENVASGSVVVGNAVRVGVEADFMHLTSGIPDGHSGYRFGSLPAGAAFGEQSANGLAGELQVSSGSFGGAIGMSPKDFPVQNWTGGLRLGSPDDSLVITRDTVKDSLLSFAGTRDPGTGIVWGGVVSNSAALHFASSESDTGLYASVGGSLLRGAHVADNWSLQGTAGAYWRAAANERRALTIGFNVTGMHYDRNLNFFSLGHGGYFSPQRYLLGAVPVSLSGRRTGLEYEISASAGIQSIKEDAAPRDPTRSNLPFYAPDSRRGANYSVAFRLEYHVASHWYVQASAGANNARDYSSRTFQIALKGLLSRVPKGTQLPLKMVPDWKGNAPFTFD